MSHFSLILVLQIKTSVNRNKKQAPQVVHVREHCIPSAYGIDTQFL